MEYRLRGRSVIQTSSHIARKQRNSIAPTAHCHTNDVEGTSTFLEKPLFVEFERQDHDKKVRQRSPSEPDVHVNAWVIELDLAALWRDFGVERLRYFT